MQNALRARSRRWGASIAALVRWVIQRDRVPPAPITPLSTKPLVAGTEKRPSHTRKVKTDSIMSAIDELMEVFYYRYRPDKGGSADYFPLKVFDGLDPRLCSHFAPRLMPKEWNNEERIFLKPWAIRAYDVPRIFNSTIFDAHDMRGDDKPFGFVRIRSIGPRRLRGKIKMVFPYLIRAEYAFFKSGTYNTIVLNAGSVDGLNWVHPNMRFNNGGEHEHTTGFHPLYDLQGRIAMGISHQLTRGFEWTVRLGYENSPTIDFCTDPTGVRSVFRLRDLPDGAKRRAALRHWVTNHYRKQRSNKSALTYVRAHLRGATDFTWNGLRCSVFPSEFDLENAEEGILPKPQTVAEYLKYKISDEEIKVREEYAQARPDWWKDEFALRND